MYSVTYNYMTSVVMTGEISYYMYIHTMSYIICVYCVLVYKHNYVVIGKYGSNFNIGIAMVI